MARLFVHCMTSVPYAARIGAGSPGLERQAERALLLARPGDVVCLPAPVDPGYLDALAELGVGPAPEDVVVAPPVPGADCGTLPGRVLAAPEVLARLVERLDRAMRRQADPLTVLHPFIVSPVVARLADTLASALGRPVRVVGGDPEIVTYADRKDRMRAAALELGIPVAKGEVVELPFPGGRRRRDLDALRDAIARWLRVTGRVIVRGARGAAGTASFVVGDEAADTESLVLEIAGREDNRVYLVEAMVEATVSPNVQMYVAPEDGTISCLGVTDQRWSRPLVHAGNSYPSGGASGPDLVCWARTLSAWLRQRGFAGPVGYDFVEYLDQRTGEPQGILAEVNPRVNGAIYPLRLLAQLNAAQRRARRPESAAFVSGTFETDARTYAELRRRAGHLFYAGGTGAGAVPYAVGCLEFGRCGAVVFGGSREEAAGAFELLRETARGGPT